jgi:hypothetical protein
MLIYQNEHILNRFEDYRIWAPWNRTLVRFVPSKEDSNIGTLKGW